MNRLNDDDGPRLDAQYRQGFYSNSTWKGISCLSYFWPYVGTEEIFEVRRAVANRTHGLRWTRESISPLAGIAGEGVEVGDVLNFVEAANSIYKAADAVLHEVVAEARARGATWDQIAEVIGVKDRKGAHNRFSKGISGQRQEEIEREGLACMTLYAIWVGFIPESSLGFSEEDWESTPIEVFISHAIRSTVKAQKVFTTALDTLGRVGPQVFEHFVSDLHRAYKLLRGSVQMLSLPRCLPVIQDYSVQDQHASKYPWLDSNAPVYYIEFVVRLTLAYQHFTDLLTALMHDDAELLDQEPQSVYVGQRINDVYANLTDAGMIIVRPELVNTIGRIEQSVVDSGDSIFMPGDKSNVNETWDILKLIWKNDDKKIAEWFRQNSS